MRTSSVPFPFQANGLSTQQQLSQQGYCLWDRQYLLNNLNCCRQTPMLYQAIRYRLNDLLSGGILFTGASGTKEIPEAVELYSNWKAWIESVIMQCFSLGWSMSITEYDQIQQTPRANRSIAATPQSMRLYTLDIEEFDIYFRKQSLGPMDWRIFRGKSGRFAYESSDYVEILNVYINVFAMPYFNGNGELLCCSVVDRIWKDAQLQRHMELCHRQSTTLMTNPTILLEDIPQKLDANMPSALDLDYHSNSTMGDKLTMNNLSNPNVITRATNLQWQDDERRWRMTQDKLRITDAGGSLHDANYDSRIVNQGPAVETQIGDLPENKKISQQVQAEATPYYMDLLWHWNDLILTQMEVPLSTRLNMNPVHGMKAEIGKQLYGAGTDESNTTANDMWIAAQQSLKKSVLDYGQRILDDMTAGARSKLPVISVRNTVTKSTVKDSVLTAENTRVLITLPGTPRDDKVTELMRNGYIKSEYYKQVESHQNNIPLDAFITGEPKLSDYLKQINGIKDESDDVSKAGKTLSKAATKAKAKSASKPKKKKKAKKK